MAEGDGTTKNTMEMRQQVDGPAVESLDILRVRVPASYPCLAGIFLIPLGEHGSVVKQDEECQVYRQPNIMGLLLEEVVQIF